MVRSIKRASLLEGIALFLMLMALASSSYVQAETLGTWTSTTVYPTAIQWQSCAAYSGYIYCVGGGPLTNAVNYASLSSGVVGTWTGTTPYPISAFALSCATDSGYIYCVGGSPLTDAVYSASVSSSGVGTWTLSTNPYPTEIEYQSCAIDSGYIYCVGGWTGSVYADAVYSASVSGGVVGTWTLSTNAYPTTIGSQSCATSSGYIYCVGGWTGSGLTDDVYSASVSGGVVGTWTLSTNAYPNNSESQSCVVYAGYMYCVGGYVIDPTFSGETDDVYYASLSSGVVGPWTSTTPYANEPTNPPYTYYGDAILSCATDSGYIYCVGGDENGVGATDAVYSAPILALASTTLITTISATASTTVATVTASPSTTLDTVTESPSTTLQTATQSPSTTLDTVTESPSTTLQTVTGSPSTTLGTVTQSPSTTVATVTASPSTTLTTISQSASTTVTTVSQSASTTVATVTQSPTTTISTVSKTATASATTTVVPTVTKTVIVVPQVTMTVSYGVVGGGLGYSAPVFHYILNGVPQTLTLTTTPAAVSVDVLSVWSVTPNSLTGSTSSERWFSTQLLTGIAIPITLQFQFQHQYYLTMQVSGPGSVVPSSGWQNAGLTVTVTAIPKPGHTFNSWTGVGTGSYTGTNNPATITMNSAITETAKFT